MATYIIDGARTAFGTFGGALKNVSDIDLGVAATKEAIKRSGIPASDIDEIVFGNVIQTGEASAYLARHIGLKSGMLESSSALNLKSFMWFRSAVNCNWCTVNCIRRGKSHCCWWN